MFDDGDTHVSYYARKLDAIRSLIEAEINKLNAEKGATIEVLERYPVNGWQYEHRAWYKNHGKPHLDKLKGEATDGV